MEKSKNISTTNIKPINDDDDEELNSSSIHNQPHTGPTGEDTKAINNIQSINVNVDKSHSLSLVEPSQAPKEQQSQGVQAMALKTF
ncbi:hypothetical protein DFA_04184 [Cavenderia fasciculata]|uniref:Uncharacterized protein n=1 Tax=Cavenderia fasciculata TaxID=261658 RepID=F4Q1I7_CACFS|nr:uncharacterized protein DFA_04184 [Cavenderia fasciculata]EGG18688.1 hypothetical protein DFA_04184 [Cavenderia fasciculata]|eukprot:XP_004366592.1 hypothetical protein DFA_04184 [Cavenderia fasciculata]